MSLLQQIDGNVKEMTMQKKTYTNVRFTNFAKFLESLTLNNVFDDDELRRRTDTGYVWNDNIRAGGIFLETNNHPLLTHGNAGDVIVCGPNDLLELFESSLDQYAEYDDKKQQPIEINIQYHDELNPELWQEVDGIYGLDPDVAEALRRAGEAFFEFLKVPDIKVVDTTITGSSANYNWTEFSDIDLHLIVDFAQAEKKYGPIIVEYFDAKKALWNDAHDIIIHGMPVEFYVQDEAEKHYSTGVYSLDTNEWIVEPKHQPPEIDDTAVKQKSKQLMREIDTATESNKARIIEALMDKIKKMRKCGLDRGGEFATGNITFKILRNNGYIEKLVDSRKRVFDRELSIEDEEFTNLLK